MKLSGKLAEIKYEALPSPPCQSLQVLVGSYFLIYKMGITPWLV